MSVHATELPAAEPVIDDISEQVNLAGLDDTKM
jgi:hypothetical protein